MTLSERVIQRLGKQLRHGNNILTGPRGTCCLCGQSLNDSESIARGFDNYCWNRIVAASEAGSESCTNPNS
jgi:hypothetical protein